MDEHRYAAPEFRLGVEAPPENVPPQTSTTLPEYQVTFTNTNPHQVAKALYEIADMLVLGRQRYHSGVLMLDRIDASRVCIRSNLVLEEVS